MFKLLPPSELHIDKQLPQWKVTEEFPACSLQLPSVQSDHSPD